MKLIVWMTFWCLRTSLGINSYFMEKFSVGFIFVTRFTLLGRGNEDNCQHGCHSFSTKVHFSLAFDGLLSPFSFFQKFV